MRQRVFHVALPVSDSAWPHLEFTSACAQLLALLHQALCDVLMNLEGSGRSDLLELPKSPKLICNYRPERSNVASGLCKPPLGVVMASYKI